MFILFRPQKVYFKAKIDSLLTFRYSFQFSIYKTLEYHWITGHSGSEGTDSLSKESDQKLAALYCKINRKLPFLKAAKGCFENSMK